ncbi:PEP-CTERM sorting domain-containing protein [Roseomonas haemaphysalidis]|uniref:PEP-CTERM sorting domain-containing protein n=1 Tax=Roseomonas haemaphysalidis TaxID=2768162 RepID=A0ABS3KZB8_9PROT|nr:PEP-CTERM sorting domain-containing protein [Roseomonas haemaphysalidis]MBO1081666.1 PEP-CTERM sorting domain-containing protein [Roseomonas haemaphysalidis]
MKSIFAAAGLMAAIAGAPLASAQANVIYTFTGTTQGAPSPTLTVLVELYNEVGESFSLSGGPSAGSAAANNLPGTNPGLSTDRFIGISVGGRGSGESVSPYFLRGVINMNLQVDSAGQVLSSSFFYLGDSFSTNFSGTGASASGFVSQDETPCRLADQNCTVTGTWALTAVPEPMSIALFGAGLAGLAMVRRRKA